MLKCCSLLLHRLTRRKYVNWKTIHETHFSRCLTTLDLTALGVGGTLGAGAYVITGQVAKSESGPAVVLSFIIAAVASILAGICYAEFGARVPKTGSAYTFTYVTVGEGLAFVIGWNLLLEYVIGAASVARTFSGYFDFLVGDKIRPWFNATMPINVETLAPYADPMALIIVLIVTVILAIGVKESATISKVFTVMNLIVLAFIIIAGCFKDDPKNWSLPAPNVTTCGTKEQSSCGDGGFAPYGFSGIVKGAATAFYAYVGFDTIATTGEEVKNPQRSIPISIILSLFIVAGIYCGLAITVTMMTPYYYLDMDAPLAKIFHDAGWNISQYVVTVGAIFALSTSILGAMFPMPRVVYAMGSDGLIFRFLGTISKRFKTPIWATVISGILSGIMAFLFDVEALVNMMSIGTLLAYTLVSISVLLLRYDVHDEDLETIGLLQNYEHVVSSCRRSSTEELSLLNLKSAISETGCVVNWLPPTGFCEALKQIIRPPTKVATPFSSKVVKTVTSLLVLKIMAVSVILTYLPGDIFYEQDVMAICLLLLFLVVMFAEILLISRQPMSSKQLSFKVPFVPVFPIVAVFFTIYLMIQLDYLTWLRFVVWMTIGFLLYFSYGMFHSSEEVNAKEARNSKCDQISPTTINGFSSSGHL